MTVENFNIVEIFEPETLAFLIARRTFNFGRLVLKV